MREIYQVYLYVILALAAGLGLGFLGRKVLAEGKIASAEKAAAAIVEEAKKAAEGKKREALVEAKEEIHRQRTELEREVRERRGELKGLERRLVQKEETLDRKIENLERKENNLRRQEEDVERIRQDVEELKKREVGELERLSGLSSEEAKGLLLKNIEVEIRHETAVLVKQIETEAKEEADRKSRDIVTQAIQRCAADYVAEATVSVVGLPNDEMKGRIIGREGRNIRTLETLTGVDLIIDDTPEAVILSSFDPIRREVARVSLEKLIADGRIHPARIEEMVEKAQKEVEQKIREEGEQAVFKMGIHGLHPELVRLLGRLRYRTSYGQNVLLHSLEVASLAGIMAAELGVDVQLARRAGLLHDIGKAIDFEEEGPHVTLGMEVARKYRENPAVLNGIEAHHGDVEPRHIEACLIQAADTISAARPGARREMLEAYIKRLKKLEEIADSFAGVEKSYAIQAGREIRILVKPEKVDDPQTFRLARDIVKKVEEELEYPGQIKIVVIRETRAVEYAK